MEGWVRLKDCRDRCVEHSRCETFLFLHARTGEVRKDLYEGYLEIQVVWCRVRTEKENFIKRWVRDHFEFHFER